MFKNDSVQLQTHKGFKKIQQVCQTHLCFLVQKLQKTTGGFRKMDKGREQ
jgi:hypothetical protein